MTYDPLRKVLLVGGGMRAIDVMALLAVAAGGQPPYDQSELPMLCEPVCYYDPEEVPKRGGRWRAVERWRSWKMRYRGAPATRMTSRHRPRFMARLDW